MKKFLWTIEEVIKCSIGCLILSALLMVLLVQTGCRTATEFRQEADEVASEIIEENQQKALGHQENFGIERPSDILRRRLLQEQQLQYSGAASLGTDVL